MPLFVEASDSNLDLWWDGYLCFKCPLRRGQFGGAKRGYGALTLTTPADTNQFINGCPLSRLAEPALRESLKISIGHDRATPGW